MEFAEYFVFALVAGLFIFCMVSFSYNFSMENYANTTVIDEPVMAKIFGNVSYQLNQSSGIASNVSVGFTEETQKNPIITTLGFVFYSIVNAGTTFISAIVGMFNQVFIFGGEFLGVSPVITGTLMAILIGLLVLAVWSMIKVGK